MAEVVRIADKTWKKTFPSCAECEEAVAAGEEFRLKTVKVDGRLMFEGAHVGCVEADGAWDSFELTPADEGLRFAREARGHRFRANAAVVYLGLPATITGGSGGRVDVIQNGVTRSVDVWSLVVA